MRKADPDDGVKGEQLASVERLLDLVDEFVVPGDGGGDALCGAPGGFGGIEGAVGDHDADGFEAANNDGAAGRFDHVVSAAPYKYSDGHYRED